MKIGLLKYFTLYGNVHIMYILRSQYTRHVSEDSFPHYVVHAVILIRTFKLIIFVCLLPLHVHVHVHTFVHAHVHVHACIVIICNQYCVLIQPHTIISGISYHWDERFCPL